MSTEVLPESSLPDCLVPLPVPTAGLMLVVIQGLRLWMGKQLYLNMTRFWTRVFGLIFAIGVVVMLNVRYHLCGL